jgi:hypothetical protein
MGAVPTMTRYWPFLASFIFSFTLFSCRGPIVTVIPNDWEIFHVTADGTDSYYNVDLIRYPTKNTVQVWTKIFVSDDDKKKMTEHFATDKYTINGQRWRYNICLLEVNCKERRVRWIQFTFYDDKGNVLNSSSSNHKGNWQLAVPDSLGDNLLKKVCNTSIRK